MVDVAAIFAKQKNVRNEDSVLKGRSFKTKPTDVFVATSPKCGTTWVTHICHMLRSNGEEVNGTFDQKVPWDVMATGAGIDIEADQGFEPRVYKSHEYMDDIAKGAKYVLVFRDPQDAFISYYNMFLRILQLSPTDLDLVGFAKHVESHIPWYATMAKFTNSALNAYETNSANMLFLYYEDLKEDRMPAIRKIAKFMGLEEALSDTEFEERCEIAFAKSSFEYMKEHPEATAARMLLKHADKVNKRPKREDNFAVTVNKGQVGGGKELPDSIKEKLSSDWKDLVENNHGYKSYEDFRHSKQ